MTGSPTRAFTLAPDLDFLDELARAVLRGFPLQEGTPPDPLTELPRWTILLPTRRAVRELERILRQRVGGRGMLMPRIRPLGDIEEDVLVPDQPAAEMAGLPDAISPIGRELALIGLIDEWAREEPRLPLAREIAASPGQAHGLAISLGEFIDGLETEDIDQSRIPELFGLESARHREAILGFLSVARVRLPMLMQAWNLSGAKERQSRVLRHEARRLRERPPAWPVVAAGSTGTVPATRELLKAIAELPIGALVLPGLDLAMDDQAWQSVGPQHPQYALRQLLESLGLRRNEVRPLAPSANPARSWLAGEFMRPPDGTESWRKTIASRRQDIQAGSRGIELVEAADRQEEAASIALMLREALETPGRTASLITPDRDLARRVKQELRRWSIDIDDSAGEPLVNAPAPALAGLLLDAAAQDFSVRSLNAFFKHRLSTFGLGPAEARRAANVLELALFRLGAGVPGLRDLPAALRRNRQTIASDSHAHLALSRLSDEDWMLATRYLETAVAALLPLAADTGTSFKDHLIAFMDCLERAAGSAIWSDEPGLVLHRLFDSLLAESGRAPPGNLQRTLAFVKHHLRSTPFRPSLGLSPRLAIYGLLEARLMRADLHILGGLNEGVWPSFPDSGPWLNRPMRARLDMQQPERSIGQTAHDFVQALGAADVKLVWSRRIGDSPVIPSRWILRLRMLLGETEESMRGKPLPKWIAWARARDKAASLTPCEKPRPRPPLAARPTKLSITQIETLIRDPYAIYARKVLALAPLDPLAGEPGPALRGTLIHEALGRFFTECPRSLPPDPLSRLMAIGREVFTPHFDIPLIAGFWWPRFQRIAEWIVSRELQDRPALSETGAEIAGKLEIPTRNGPFTLSGRADRIDIRADGEARIIDYKTGAVRTARQVGSGLSPQLTLEAAMLEQGAFAGMGKAQTAELIYVKLSGGEPPGEMTVLKFDDPVMDVAHRHVQGLATLVDAYADPLCAYLPRPVAVKIDDELDYDHLSRYREWLLSGERK